MAIERERGSALVIALLVAFILSLLGASFLMTAQAESRIAQNERLATEAFFAAEAGARVVQAWFDRPRLAEGFPDVAVVDRSLRQVLNEADPYNGAPVSGAPLYKQGVDLDGDSADDLFERPYRSPNGWLHALMGREDGPDMRISADAGGASDAFLTQLSATLFGPLAVAEGQRVRIRRIDVYAPPYVLSGSSWGRYGMATVKVVARVQKLNESGNETAVRAEQTVKVVLNEIPYKTPVFGPLHSCANLTFSDTLRAHWGAVTATGELHGYSGSSPNVPFSIPRGVPSGNTRSDRLWTSHPECVAEFANRVNSVTNPVPDPWLRLAFGGEILGAANPDFQPYPPSLPAAGCDPNGAAPPYWSCCDRSNLTQRQISVGCAVYDYDFWKNVAASGGHDVHYYVPVAGSQDPVKFEENGVAGNPRTFQEITADREGLFFFDTKDGHAPHDDNGDGVPENLTPEIVVSGSWRSSGFVYVNTIRFKSEGVSSPATSTLQAPGEPYLDANGDRQFEPGEAWINLGYPSSLGQSFRIDPSNTAQDDGTTGPSPVHNSRGPAIAAGVSFHGILYTSGVFEGTGSGLYYGSVIADRGIELPSPAPDFYWDAAIAGDWPPVGATLPRTTVTGWTREP